MALNVPATTAELIRRLLDDGYENSATRVLEAVTENVTTGIVEQRLRELNEEAARLEEAGLKLTPDNPVLTALLVALDPALHNAASDIDNGAGQVQTDGVEAAGMMTRQLALPGFSDDELRVIGIVWNTPDPEAVNQLVNFVDSVGWADEIQSYPDLVLNAVNNLTIRSFVEGWGPIRTAREITRMSESLPLSQANNLLRTLYLTSSRTATAVHQTANADILEFQIRMAVLDDRVCLCCIAESGTRLPIGARINDHHQGRCFAITQVRGLPQRNIITGIEWFNSQPEERRLWIAGPANFGALNSGVATLQDFVQPYSDPVFGEMLRERSLVGILGEGAERFYSN